MGYFHYKRGRLRNACENTTVGRTPSSRTGALAGPPAVGRPSLAPGRAVWECSLPLGWRVDQRWLPPIHANLPRLENDGVAYNHGGIPNAERVFDRPGLPPLYFHCPFQQERNIDAPNDDRPAALDALGRINGVSPNDIRETLLRHIRVPMSSIQTIATRLHRLLQSEFQPTGQVYWR
jgi:hypothetical protein